MMEGTGPGGPAAKDGSNMKKHRRQGLALSLLELALLIGVTVLLVTGAWAANTQGELADRVVRLHVTANSDSAEDQALKLKVRDAVLARTEELLKASADRAEAAARLTAALPELERLAEETAAAGGFACGVTAELAETSFPTKEYDGFALPAGRYLALRIVIGEGAGQNWWCVVFPPLCTAAASEVPETALAAGLTEDQVSLITEEDGGYALKFKVVEWWQALRERMAD